MTTVVTGASGHLGANLIRTLLEQGRQVRVLVRKDTRALEGLSLERVPGNVLDPDSLQRAFSGVEVAYHAVGQIVLRGDPGDVGFKVNVEGTRNVVEACLTCGVRRLVHVSSVHALAQLPLDKTLDETRPLAESKRDLAYDRTKAMAEREVAAGVERGLDAVIINPTAIIGPHDFKPSAMGQVLLDIYHRRLPALVLGGFDWVDARDIALGAIAAERRGRVGERYLLAGHWASFRALADLVEEVTTVRPRRLAVPLWLAYIGLPFINLYCRIRGIPSWYTRDVLQVLRHSNRLVSHEKASQELGYQPRPLVETLRDTFTWFHQTGCLNDRFRALEHERDTVVERS